MDNRQHFKKYLTKLRFEALLNSLLSGLVVGFIANFITALVTWFTPYNGLLLSLGILAGVTTVGTVFFYFKKFYPTVFSTARRLDKLGLEERLITMIEYESDDSYMSAIQRTDAEEALKSINSKSIKLRIPRKLQSRFVVCMLLCIIMNVVLTLSLNGFLPSGTDIIDKVIPDDPEEFVSITYDVEGAGSIEGEQDQLILLGSNATPVTAVPDEGYVFVEWSDGSTKPYRTDKELKADIEVFAIFEPAEGEGEGEGEGDGDGDGEGDGDGQGDGNGNGEGEGEGNGNGNGTGNGDKKNQGGTTGGGKYEYANQIIDGETFYREVLDEYKDQIAEYLEKNRDNLTDDEIKVIEQYLGIV